MSFRSHLGDPRLADVWACVCLFSFVIVAGLATNPFFNAGVNDDWAYSQMAVRFAQTGRIAYGGWPTAAALIQTAYGALLTKLFGGSFLTHRLGTLFLSGLTPIFVYWLGLRFALKRQMAFFGAMTVGLSPLFIPHAVSFMTDSYGCLFFLAAIYAGVKSADQTSPSRAVALFSLAMVLSFLGGLNRQALWVTGPAIALGYCYAWRKEYRHLLWGIALLTIFVVDCLLVLSWLKQQPDFQYEMIGGRTLALTESQFKSAAHAYGGLFLTTAVFAIPALSLGVNFLRRPSGALLASLAAAAAFGATFWKSAFMFPYLNNVVTQYGLFLPNLLLLGRLPVVLPAVVCRLVTAITSGLLALLLANWFSKTRDAIERTSWTGFFFSRWEQVTLAAMLIPVGSVAGYLFVLIVRAKTSALYDRYSMPLLPLLIIAILAIWQSCGLRSPGLVAWVALFFFGIYGVAITHDHFQQVRARQRAASALEAASVPRQRILAGFEDDMWTQVAWDGRLVRGPDTLARIQPNAPRVWYLYMTPRIEPLYFLATSDMPHMTPCKFQPVHYSTWLFPRDRQVLTLCPE